MRTKWFVLGLVLMLTACQGLSATPFPEEYSQNVDLGEYALQLTCAGKGEPTLIFENAENDITWSNYEPDPLYTPVRFKEVSRTCIYNKFNTIRNHDVKLSSARTALDQVHDLHNLLKKAGVPGPYILVGTGIASTNILLYTKEYPKEVVGLVCVNCNAPGFWRTFFEQFEASEIEFSPEIVALVNEIKSYTENYTKSVELLDIAASCKLAEEVTDLGDRPFIVLNQEPTDPAVADVATAFWDGIWFPMSEDMCHLSSRCQFQIVEGVTEMTILQDKSVDAAVQEVYEETKGK